MATRLGNLLGYVPTSGGLEFMQLRLELVKLFFGDIDGVA
jgi:hypothetical protein